MADRKPYITIPVIWAAIEPCMNSHAPWSRGSEKWSSPRARRRREATKAAGYRSDYRGVAAVRTAGGFLAVGPSATALAMSTTLVIRALGSITGSQNVYGTPFRRVNLT